MSDSEALTQLDSLVADYTEGIRGSWMRRESEFLSDLRRIIAAGRPVCEHGWLRPHGLMFTSTRCPGPTEPTGGTVMDKL